MAESSTRSVERALNLLAAVCERSQASLADVSRDVDLPPSTALRLLRTLESTGFVGRTDDGGYQAGTRLLQLGTQALASSSLKMHAKDPMQDVVAATGESVYLCVLGHRQTAVYIAIEEGHHSVRHTNWVGRTIPLRGTAAGQVFAGDVPDVGFVVAQNTVEPDVTAISAPVVVQGRTVGVMSALVPTYRVTEESAGFIGHTLARAASSLVRQLGG